MIAGHQQATRELWSHLEQFYDTFVSALVYEEAEEGDVHQARLRLEAIKPFRMLDIDEESRTLAERILAARAIPREYPEDALHIDVAAVNGMNLVLT